VGAGAGTGIMAGGWGIGGAGGMLTGGGTSPMFVLYVTTGPGSAAGGAGTTGVGATTAGGAGITGAGSTGAGSTVSTGVGSAGGVLTAGSGVGVAVGVTVEVVGAGAGLFCAFDAATAKNSPPATTTAELAPNRADLMCIRRVYQNGRQINRPKES